MNGHCRVVVCVLPEVRVGRANDGGVAGHDLLDVGVASELDARHDLVHLAELVARQHVVRVAVVDARRDLVHGRLVDQGRSRVHGRHHHSGCGVRGSSDRRIVQHSLLKVVRV
jgi:hypothetical protein